LLPFIERIYVKGSLTNIDLDGDGKPDSFQFQLTNPFPYGGSISSMSLKIDDEAVPPDSIEAELEGKVWKGGEVSDKNPVYIKPFATVYVRVKGRTLTPGEHKLSITIRILELGQSYTIEVKDTVK